MADHLKFGQRVRTACSATGRFIGTYDGDELALVVSAMDNSLFVDAVDRGREPHPTLPVPTDRELQAAGAGIRHGTRLGERRDRRA